MPAPRFRGNPYHVLDVRFDASNATIKRRWRALAREHHPDRAAGDGDEAAQLTTRMARINAAYDLLRDPVRRAHFDSSSEGRRAREAAGGRAAGAEFDDGGIAHSGGPPPPPVTAPVTARFDTSASFRPRNARVGERQGTMRGQPPLSRRAFDAQRDLRASTPTGPVERRPGAQAERMPTLGEAREATLEFGRYHGYTLGEVELIEPAYLDWIARTITRDRDLVTKARVIQGELNRRGASPTKESAVPGYEDRAPAG